MPRLVGPLDLARGPVPGAGRPGGTLVLVGAPGAGKTAMLDAAARSATEAVVLRAEGVESEADLRFSGLHQVLLPLAADIATLDPPHRTALGVTVGFEAGPVPRRRVLHDAVLTLLRQVARTRRVLILIDDLHRVDRSSVSVLRQVGRRLDGTGVVLLVAVRPEYAALFAHPGFIEHELDPLDDDRAAPDPSHGHVVDLGDRGTRRPAGARSRRPPLPGPATTTTSTLGRRRHAARPMSRRHLLAVVESRMHGLSAEARRFVLVAALGDPGDPELLLRSLPASARDEIPRTAELAGLLRLDRRGHTVRFHPPAVRTAVVDLATSSELARAHRTLAALLSDRPDRQAWHLAGAAEGPDEHVARALQRAAVGSLHRGDPGGAVATLVRAAELSPPGPERAHRIARAAHLGAEVTGDLRAVRRLVDDAGATDSHLVTSLWGVAAAAHLLLHRDGDVDTSFRLLIEAVETTPTGAGVDDGFVDALHTLLVVCTFGCRSDWWARYHAVLARLRPHVPVLLELCAWTQGCAPRPSDALLDGLSTAVAELRDETDPRQIVRVATAAFSLDRSDRCRDALWRLVHDGRSGGATASAISAMTILACDAYHAGRWDDARDLAEEGLARSDALGYRLLAAPGRFCLSLLAAARGDGDAVRALTDDVVTWGVPRGVRRLAVYAGAARTLSALGRGDFEDAYHEAAAVSPPGALDPGSGPVLSLTMDLVEAAARSHRHAEAAAHVLAVQALGTTGLGPRQVLLAAGAAAMAAPDHRAGELYEAALALHDVERWPFDLARIRLAYGEHLRRSRATTAARRHLSGALDTFTGLGAHPWVARARTELRAAGHDPARARGQHDPDEPTLTPQELEVANLAASGMTNRQIADRLRLSRRTVDAHLYRAFPKLDITGRAALRDALDRRYGDVGEDESPHGCLAGAGGPAWGRRGNDPDQALEGA